jgi:CheY-like chemotaxis protein/HPt (histidine-containing phosphotransfer) domain-containing protein
MGIPAHQQQRIFEAFTQADSSMSRQFGGTGLGLAIAAQLVAAMKGRIWVESEVGRGSRFHFTAVFGLAREAPTPTPAEPASLKDLPVLIVDDNETNRRIFEEMLGSWGMRPTVAESGRAGLAALRQAAAAGQPFRLVLLDAMMPEMNGFACAERIKASPDLAGCKVLMLSSAGRLEEAQRYREANIARCLTKPVKQSDLLNAILEVLGAPVVEPQPATLLGGAPSNLATPLRILLAEDSPVNQIVAVRFLEIRGHSVVVANNGLQALEALERQPFDVVLMDVQMPELDGLEATARLRRREQGTGRHVPVIAMTAHAMKGDRERCLAAGMDGYVAKPIRPQELFEAIEGLLPARAKSEPAASAPPSPDAVFDHAEALRHAAGDPELLRELVQVFLDSCPRQLSDLREAITRRDSQTVRREAHRLKGELNTFGAKAAGAVALRLETMGRAGELDQAGEVYAALEDALTRLTPALAKLRDDGAKAD